MKCEICNKKDAQTAIVLNDESGERELYVCKECARHERIKRQKKREMTRKAGGAPRGISITAVGNIPEGEEPPPFLAALMDAMSSVVDDLERVVKSGRNEAKSDKKEPEYKELTEIPAGSDFCIRGMLHLEGLHMIGELEAAARAMRAIGLRLVGVDVDGVNGAAHIYKVEYLASEKNGKARSKRAVRHLVDQEHNARVRLCEEMPRVFGDSLCRALAILKNCRLLSPAEFLDLLSPLRLAAFEDLLDGITREEIEDLMEAQDLSNRSELLEPEERDRLDAERADSANERFEDVVLNERAEEKFI